MLLKSLEIKNFRSLEDVKLQKLGQFNVLIGRNNSGKSAIINSLVLLNSSIHGTEVDWTSVVTGRDPNRPLEIRLQFESTPNERRQYIELLGMPDDSVERRKAMFESPLLRRVEFLFKSVEGIPQLLHLRHTRVMTEINEWATIQELRSEEKSGNPPSQVKVIGEEIKRHPKEPVGKQFLDIGAPSGTQEVRIHVNFRPNPFHSDPPTRWFTDKLAEFLENAYFFNPFRHSAAVLDVRETPKLGQDGSNLAQVLHTINSNDRAMFRRIEEFVQMALPDIGNLQTPLMAAKTEVRFLSPKGYHIRLHDMGGGVEQLLMIAIVLLTTSSEHALFVEEPESHLHPGAIRFLTERMYQTNRQIFATTHSPVLINQTRPLVIHQVKYTNNTTNVSFVGASGILGELLVDIGSRNSDVLLSDGVLFVEGPSDRDALIAWSKTLELNLEERNVTVLPMGGGERADRGTRSRSQVLEGISRQASVPHLFLLDRDERSDVEVERIISSIGNKAHVLESRELENYLLSPRAIIEALKLKYRNVSAIESQLSSTSTQAIQKLIDRSAETLYGLVLVKRVRAELDGLPGGFIPREMVNKLASEAGNENFPSVVENELQQRVRARLEGIDVQSVVRSHRDRLNEEWTITASRVKIAPGEEILQEIYRAFGGDYDKSTDAARIAEQMTAEEIQEEIRELISKAAALAERT